MINYPQINPKPRLNYTRWYNLLDTFPLFYSSTHVQLGSQIHSIPHINIISVHSSIYSSLSLSGQIHQSAITLIEGHHSAQSISATRNNDYYLVGTWSTNQVRTYFVSFTPSQGGQWPMINYKTILINGIYHRPFTSDGINDR